jgi:uncharacterized cupredoxin-like copper-binding protein
MWLFVAAAAGGACSHSDAKVQAVTVVGTEMSFTPSELSAGPGEVRFTLQNTGSVFHELAVEHGDSALGRESAGPGSAAQFNVKVAPGDYELTCREPGHYEAGMRGTLHVR